MTTKAMARVSRRKEIARLAGDRSGILTASDAKSLGVSSSALAYHTRTGAIQRLARGVYRFADIPASSEEPIIAAAAALGPEAVLSHESALKLYDVCNVAPSQLIYTIPRKRRYRISPAADVEIHTTSREFVPGDVVQYEGFRATSLARSIVDSARTHTAPEQIIMAVGEGLRRNLLTRHDLERALRQASSRVRQIVERGIADR